MPVNQTGNISKIYTDNCVDIQLNDENVIRHVEVIGVPILNDPVLLTFLENDFAQPVAITKTAEGGGDIDLRDYVKKSDVDLKFDLEDNGTITIGIDIGDGF